MDRRILAKTPETIQIVVLLFQNPLQVTDAKKERQLTEVLLGLAQTQIQDQLAVRKTTNTYLLSTNLLIFVKAILSPKYLLLGHQAMGTSKQNLFKIKSHQADQWLKLQRLVQIDTQMCLHAFTKVWQAHHLTRAIKDFNNFKVQDLEMKQEAEIKVDKEMQAEIDRKTYLNQNHYIKETFLRLSN